MVTNGVRFSCHNFPTFFEKSIVSKMPRKATRNIPILSRISAPNRASDAPGSHKHLSKTPCESSREFRGLSSIFSSLRCWRSGIPRRLARSTSHDRRALDLRAIDICRVRNRRYRFRTTVEREKCRKYSRAGRGWRVNDGCDIREAKDSGLACPKVWTKFMESTTLWLSEHAEKIFLLLGSSSRLRPSVLWKERKGYAPFAPVYWTNCCWNHQSRQGESDSFIPG